MAQRKLNDFGLALIKKFEGYSAYPYICPAGHWTIGWGSTRDLADQPITKSSGMVNVEQAVQLLEREVRRACASVQRLIKVPLDDNQFAALVSFVYNLGGGALQRSTLRAKLNRGDYAGAAGQFKRWINANGRPMKGLMRRRAEEQNLFSSVFKSQDEANEWYNTMWGLQMSR